MRALLRRLLGVERELKALRDEVENLKREKIDSLDRVARYM